MNNQSDPHGQSFNEQHLVQVVGNAVIAMKDRTFADGYRQGYILYHQLFAGKRLSDEQIYAFLVESIIDVKHPGRWNAGRITGWLAAVCETRPSRQDVVQLVHVQIEDVVEVGSDE